MKIAVVGAALKLAATVGCGMRMRLNAFWNSTRMFKLMPSVMRKFRLIFIASFG